MDHRLDLFNSVKNFESKMTKDEALYIVCHNKKDGDLFIGISGDVDLLSVCLSGENGYITLKTDEQIKNHKYAQRMALNIAINILRVNKDLRNIFYDALKFLP